MNSPAVWEMAAGSAGRAMVWRDAATALMRATPHYRPYLEIVESAAAEASLDQEATERLLRAWPRMRRWPDAVALESFDGPYAFVTNCSRGLAEIATRRSRLAPQFVLSAEEAGRFKPAAEIYHQACRRIGTDPGRTAFVAGSSYDAVGARDAGLVPWLVARDTSAPTVPGVQVAQTLEDVLASVRSPA